MLDGTTVETARQRRLRWLPLLVGGLLGGLWFLAFHYRLHEGSAVGSAVLLRDHPQLLRLSVPGFLIAFTVGSAAIWMPCIMQMVLVFSGVGAGAHGRFRGGWFFAGYIGTYATMGAVAALVGEAFGRLHLVALLQIVGGASVAFIGLSLLDLLKHRLLKPCASALAFAMQGGRLHRLGRASTGVAFAIYCAGCCGPLLYPLFLFAAASGSFVLGLAIATGFALAMAVPIGVLGALGRQSLAPVRRVVDNYDLIARSAGAALVALGALLLLNRPLILGVESLHHLLGE